MGGRGADETVTECLGRMVAWSRLVEEVCLAEFPDFELLNAFAVFRLVHQTTAPAPNMPHDASRATIASQLQRLAGAFRTNPAGLMDQFEEHERIAQTVLAKAPAEPAARAWQQALKQTQSSDRRKRTFPVDALLPLLQRFLVAPGSTAGIEQNFSKLKRILGEHWNGSELAEERRLVLDLAVSENPEADADLLGAARLVWASTFGTPRASAPKLAPRKAVMHARQEQQTERTAAAWLRRRRQIVADLALKSNGAADQDVVAAADAVWAVGHTREAEFQ